LFNDGAGSLIRLGGQSTSTKGYYAPVSTGVFIYGMDLPAARYSHSSIKLGSYGYVFGGFLTANTATVLKAPTSSSYGTWTSTLSLPETSFNGAAFVLGDAIYVAIGGNSSTSWSDKVYKGVVGAGGDITSWTHHSTYPGARSRFSDIPTYNGRAYIVGGENSAGNAVQAVSMLWGAPQLPITGTKPLGFNDGIGY
jgi:N-acetylneuraminic acid mutarotase